MDVISKPQARANATQARMHAADEEFLDSVFDEVLTRIEEGQEISADSLLRGRGHLRDALEELVESARAVACSPPTSSGSPQVSGYTLRGEIGRGGMGAVYLATQDRAGGRVVALKVLPSLFGSASARDRFRREALAVAQLRHSNIVTVYDVHLEGQSIAYAMEYIDGCSLDGIIREVAARPDVADIAACEAMGLQGAGAAVSEYPRRVARWGVQIADALHAVHAAGMLHRDVKPSNILLRRDGSGATLADFGLVHDAAAASLTVSGAFSGTVAYASPEQLRGGSQTLDARADVYSLGATLFHALTLRRPFRGFSAVEVLRELETQGNPRLRGGPVAIPRELETIIRKAMSPDRGQRYATAAELAADLTRFLHQEPIAARPLTLTYRATKLLVRNRRVVASGLGASFIVLVLLLGLYARSTLFPRWSGEYLQEARAARLVANHEAYIFNELFWEMRSHSPWDSGLLARTQRAVKAYDQAAMLGEASGPAIAERAAVAALPAIIASSLVPISEGAVPPTGEELASTMMAESKAIFAAMSPTVRGYIKAVAARRVQEQKPQVYWSDDGVLVEPRVVAAATTDELRQIGFLAYALRDVRTAMAAWSALEVRGAEDPYISGLLGVVYLIEDRPELAYPRLQLAMMAFENMPNFAIHAADAAMRCGDLWRAEQFLARAAALPGHDERGAYRIEMMIRLQRGEREAVLKSICEQFDRAQGGKASAVLAVQACEYLERSGASVQEQMPFLVLTTEGSPQAGRAQKYAFPRIASWWSEQSLEVRKDLVRKMLHRAGTSRAQWEHHVVWSVIWCGSDVYPNRLPDSPDPQAMVHVSERFWQVQGMGMGGGDVPLKLDPAKEEAVVAWLTTGRGDRLAN